jgi:hypothetical protein
MFFSQVPYLLKLCRPKATHKITPDAKPMVEKVNGSCSKNAEAKIVKNG